MKISVENLSFQYPSGVQALEDIDLTIEAGEAVVFVGENGAGKSTPAKQINGLLNPTAGRVQVGDLDTSQHSTAKLSQHVGFLFQNPDEQLFARTVQIEVAFGPRNLDLPADEVDARVAQALDEVGLVNTAEKHPYDLHYAQRKLVALATILAMQTPILILDEPTTGQDAPTIDRIGSIIEQRKAQGHTVIGITHDLDFCAQYFDRVVVLGGGRVLADGPSTEVLVQSDLLAQAAVEPPQIIRLAQALGMQSAPRTPAEFIQLYTEHKQHERD